MISILSVTFSPVSVMVMMKAFFTILFFFIFVIAPAQGKDSGWTKDRIHIRIVKCKMAKQTKDSVIAEVTVKVVNHGNVTLDAYGPGCQPKSTAGLVYPGDSASFTFYSEIKIGLIFFNEHCFAYKNRETNCWTFFNLFLEAVCLTYDKPMCYYVNYEWDYNGGYRILHSY